jgi:hypothetical protein
LATQRFDRIGGWRARKRFPQTARRAEAKGGGCRREEAIRELLKRHRDSRLTVVDVKAVERLCEEARIDAYAIEKSHPT